MQTVVLNYSNGKVYIINHEKPYQSEELEIVLTEKYNFRLSEIERMTTQELEIQTEILNEI